VLILAAKWKPKISDIKTIRFQRASMKCCVKTSYESLIYKEIDIMKTEFEEKVLNRRLIAPNGSVLSLLSRAHVRGISREKKEDLLSMAQLLHSQSRVFFENLICCDDVVDLEIDQEFDLEF
jgi:hypothetical protein